MDTISKDVAAADANQNSARDNKENKNPEGAFRHSAPASHACISGGGSQCGKPHEHVHTPSKVERRQFWVSVMTLAAAVIYTGTTIALVFDGRKVAAIQAAHADAQARPWIKFNSLELFGDALTGRDEWHLRLSASLKNVGTTPARNIWFAFDVVPMAANVDSADIRIQEIVRSTCRQAIIGDGPAKLRREFSFPGETPGFGTSVNIDGMLREYEHSGPIEVRRMIVAAYAVYEFTFGEGKHCTAAAYVVSRKSGSPLLPVPRDDFVFVNGQKRDGIPMEDILLQPFPLGGVYAD